MRRRSTWAFAVLPLLGLGCSHSPTAGFVSEPVVWPAPPAAPRVRLAGVFPAPGADTVHRSTWRRVLDLLAGTDPEGEASPLLVRPYGVAALSGGGFAVADPDARTVLQVVRDRTDARSCSQREWIAPSGVAEERPGVLLVADVDAIVRVREKGCDLLAQGAFERATGVAARGDRIYVVDPPRHELILLESSGKITARMGPTERAADGTRFPSAIAVAPDGRLLVADALGFSIAIYSPEGALLSRLGGVQRDGGELIGRPKGIAQSESGRVYVADAERDEVVVFDDRGDVEYRIGASGAEPGRFAHPAGLALAGDRLIVADSLNGRLQFFEFIGGAP